ncbi:MAG: DUF3021 domain-containing protein [Ruminococcus sp.]|nr:DUF3021 domain-containing protein [Ruminococcus sp.]
MKRTSKLIIKYLLFGISLGCTFFMVTCLAFSLAGREDILMLICKDFARQSAGAMLVGIAGGGTSVIYQFDRPSSFSKRIIHFCVGMGVFYPVAICLGWIPFYPGNVTLTLLQLLFTCGIFMLIWSCFYLFNRSEAKRINERLRELERDNAGNEKG